MDRWFGKVAVVTGASAGIGESISIKLVLAGMQVAGFARRVEKVSALSKKLANKKGKLFAVKCDVTNEQEILQAFKWVQANMGPVAVLVNNAGVSRPQTLLDGNTEEWKLIIDTNFLGLCICTREGTRQMRDNNIAGHVIHINSICGHYVPNIPLNSVYPGTKHAVTALTDGLRKELVDIDSKIKVTSISPGFVDTDIIVANGYDKIEGIEKLQNSPKLHSEDIADAVLYVLGTPEHVMVQELVIRPVGEKL